MNVDVILYIEIHCNSVSSSCLREFFDVRVFNSFVWSNSSLLPTVARCHHEVSSHELMNNITMRLNMGHLSLIISLVMEK